jgi:hypothetical protein
VSIAINVGIPARQLETSRGCYAAEARAEGEDRDGTAERDGAADLRRRRLERREEFFAAHGSTRSGVRDMGEPVSAHESLAERRRTHPAGTRGW